MKDAYDVVIVGGGIAGSALGAVLAQRGIDTLVLERTTEYRDRVRGEAMLPWGVAELKRLGLYDTLIAAGGIHSQTWFIYDEGQTREESEAFPIPVGLVLPDAAPLNLGHPAACAALAQAARDNGAEVVCGAMNAQLQRDPLGVSFAVDGTAHEVGARLIIGADGRTSTIRDQAGIALERQEPTHMMAGLLVQPTREIPDNDVIATEGDVTMLYFVQPAGKVRVYIAPSMDQRSRYRGAGGTAEFLRAVRMECVPHSDALAEGRAAGPCATYPGDETWTDAPFTDGVVLIGDAAGHNSPILGQGLSLAMRDVRMVSDILLSNEEWSPEIFRPYGMERFERMRRVRFDANLMAAIATDFGPGAIERRSAAAQRRLTDPVLLQGLLCPFTGPETAPPEAFTDEAWQRVVRASA